MYIKICMNICIVEMNLYKKRCIKNVSLYILD